MPVLVFLLYKFAAFTYHEIDYFISVTAYSTLAIHLPILNFSFGVISSIGIILCADGDSVSLFKFLIIIIIIIIISS